MISINKTILPLALTTLVFCSVSHGASMISTDPFIQEWDYFDGIKTYKLNITQSRAPGQNYHIDYTFQGGQASTDMCVITSNTSFHCLPGETVTRDDSQHSVTVTSQYGTYTYYDPSHMPPVASIYGNWSWHQKDAVYTISIMKGVSDTQYNIMTSFSDGSGNYCSHGEPYAYDVTKKSDGTEIISRGSGFNKYSFKFDPQKNQITNPSSSKYFNIGRCIQLYDEDGSAVFTRS